MDSTSTTLKINVPALRPAPAIAIRIGGWAAMALAAAEQAVIAAQHTLAAIRPATLRSQLRHSAAAARARRPALAESLSALATKAWDH